MEIKSISRLQFRHHNEVFTGATLEEARELAIEFISGCTSDFWYDNLDNTLAHSLYSEPTIIRYSVEGEEDNPHIILVIGSQTNETERPENNKYCIIDIDKTENEIADIVEELEKAIKSLTLAVFDTDSLDLHVEKTENGTFLSGDVKTATFHIWDDETKYNNLFIASRDEATGPEGLFIYVDLTYDDASESFTFTTSNYDGTLRDITVKLPNNYLVSGTYSVQDQSLHLKMRNGDDVVVDCTKLIMEWDVEGEASSTPIVLTREEVGYDGVDEYHHLEPWQDVLRADIRIGGNVENNILEKSIDGRYLYVDGQATNIVYYYGGSATTVADTLNELKKIKLSQDSSNILQNRADGFFANTTLDFVSDKNQLVFRTTNIDGSIKEKTLQLNTVDIPIENIYYDPTTEDLVIIWKNDKGEIKTIRINIGQMIDEWEVLNPGHNVTLQKTHKVSGKDQLSADANIYDGDNNILVDRDHSLYVKGTADNIKYNNTTVEGALDTLREDLDNEVDRATSAEEVLTNKIGTGFTDDPHENVTAKFEALSGKLDSEIVSARTEEARIEGRLNAEIARAEGEEQRIETKLDDEISRSTDKDVEHDTHLSTIDTTIGSGFTTDSHETVTYKFNELNNKVDSEISRATSAETTLDEKIDSEISRATSAETTLNDKIDDEITRSTDKDIEHDTHLNTIDVTIGSGFTTDSHETVTYKFNELNDKTDNEITRAISAETALDAKIDSEITRSTEKDNEHDSRLDSVDAEIEELSANTLSSVKNITSNNKSLTVTKSVGNDPIIDLKVNIFPESGNTLAHITMGDNNGIFNFVDLNYDEDHNDLIFKKSLSNGVITSNTIHLESISFIDRIYYDDHTQELVVIYYSGHDRKEMRIPLGSLIDEWDVYNDQHSVVKLHKEWDSGYTKYLLSGEAIISEKEDNILENQEGKLYVSNSAITANAAAIAAETDRAQNAEDTLDEKIENEISRATSAETTLDEKIDSEISRATAKETDLENSIDEEAQRATAAEELLTNKIGTGFTDDPHENVTYKFNELNDKTDNEISRATSAETTLDEKIDSEITRSISAETTLNDKIDDEVSRSTDKDIEHDTHLSTIDTTIGSGFTTDSHETVTYKFNELNDKTDNEITRAEGEEQRIENKLDSEITRSTEKDNEHDSRLDSIDAEIGNGFDPRNTVRDEIENLQSEIDAVSADSASSIKDVINTDHSIDVDKTNVTKPVIKVNLSEEVEDNKPNIIKLNTDGLYAGVDLIYDFDPDNGKNDLIFKTTNGSKTIGLKTASVVDRIYYDQSREAIIIEYSVNGHRMPDVVVPVGDLINEWRVEDGHPHAVQLERVRESGATQDVLKASVVITDSHDDNILVMDNGTLYVSNSGIAANAAAIESLEGRMDTAEADIDTLQNDLREEISARTLADDALGRRIDQEIVDRIADVDAEESRAISAETALSNKINADVLAEKNRAISAETALDAKINNEISDRIADVNAEQTRAEAAELALSGKIDTDILAERNRAISAETDLQTAIDNERTRAINAEDTLNTNLTTRINETAAVLSAYTQTSVNDEKTRAMTAEGELRQAIQDETARANAADQLLQDAIDDEISRSTAKDTEHDAKISALEASAATINSDIISERTRAISAETALDAKINNEISDRIADVNAEQTRAEAAELALSSKIDTDILAERNRAISAETALQTAIDNERTRAINAEGTLDTNLTTRINETATILSAYTQTSVNDEKTRAMTAEGELRQAIQDETARANSADQMLQDAIDDEVARSTAKDTEHDAKISALETSAATLNSDIISERTRATSAETALQTAINNEVTRATNEEERIEAKLDNEINRAISADTKLSNDIELESARAIAIENSLANSASTNASNITAEAVRASSAETVLQNAIDREESRAISAETMISHLLDDERTRAMSAEAGLSDAITSETQARQDAIDNLIDRIDNVTLEFNDTGSIDFSATTAATGSVITADVKLREGSNIIKCGDTGLYANVDLSYDPSTNKIKVVTSDGDGTEIQLVGASLLENLYYDAEHKELVIVYKDAAGVEHTVRFDVAELFNDWEVDQPSCVAIELTKTNGTSGQPDKLSGRVKVSSNPDNALQIVDNALFISKSEAEGAGEIARCTRNELYSLEKTVIGHRIDTECGSGYTYEPNTMATYISAASSFNNADVIIDTNLKRVEDKLDSTSTSAVCIDSKANKLYELLVGTGATIQSCGEGTQYIPDLGSCILSAATSFMEADRLLGDQVCEILEMWQSGMTCTSISDWVDDGANKRLEVDVRASHGNTARQTDEELVITDFIGDYIDPTRTEFTDTNALRIVCLQEGESGSTPDVKSLQNGLYLSNVWDCGLYYGSSDSAAKSKARAAGYIVDPYSTDEDSSAYDYDYNNNVRQ